MIISFLNDAYDFLFSSVYSITESGTGGKKKVVMQFDTIEEVNFRASSNVTTYPIEYGYMATDYKYNNPSVLEMTGIISRNSIIGGLVNKALDRDSIVESLNTTLEYYKRGLYALDIMTKTGLRTNYTLQDYEIPENIDNFSLIEVNMTFVEILSTTLKRAKEPEDTNTISAGIVKIVGLS